MKRLDYCISFVFALLGAHFANAGWVCAKDGVPVAPDSIQINEDHEIPTNCTYDGFEVSEEGNYFEVRAGNSFSYVDVAVGVATEPASGVEAPLKGIFYNNEVFDGNGKTLQKHFGDKVNPGKHNAYSTVGVFVKKNEEGGVTLHLLHDSVPLGPALIIRNPSSPLYPAVLASGEVTIQYLPTATSELPDKPLERSGDIINNIFQLTSLSGGPETSECLSEQIRLRPVADHELKTKYNDESETVSFYISFISEDPDKVVGYLEKNGGSGQRWQLDDLEKGDDDAERSECLKFVKSVFKDVTSFELKESKIIASASETGKSFEAVKSEFPTVAQDDFEKSD